MNISANDYIVLRLASSYLCSRDLANLSLTCRRFGSTQNIEGSQQQEEMSLMEGITRDIINSTQTEEERGALPRKNGQSYIELYSELERLRAPRIFDQLIGRAIQDPICSVGNDGSCIMLLGNKKQNNTAISSHVMMAGRHYASFTNEGADGYMRIGVTRPLKDVNTNSLPSFDPIGRGYSTLLRDMFPDRALNWGNGNINYCAVMAGSGINNWHYSDWQNVHECLQWQTREQFGKGDKIGLLLDLNEGTLKVIRDGRTIGEPKQGLTGDYCWVVTMWTHGVGVSIKQEPIPDI